MNNYEEKREKLTLMVVELRHIGDSLYAHCNVPDNYFINDIYNMEMIDRIMVESYSIIKGNENIVMALNSIRRFLNTINSQKIILMNILSFSRGDIYNNMKINELRNLIRSIFPEMASNIKIIESVLENNYGIINPYKTASQ
ncbi:hypothetical protein [Asticcacaulis sp.]|uniref:hypothetical protein n=1 Tax=Asticcacaulis sp. TaxID=1872648 RepID=UPI003F7BE459